MMPPLPPLHSLSLHHPFDDARDYAIAYGRAVAEACAAKCEEIATAANKMYKGKLPDQERGTAYHPHDDGRCSGAFECADAIREMASAAKHQQQE